MSGGLGYFLGRTVGKHPLISIAAVIGFVVWLAMAGDTRQASGAPATKAEVDAAMAQTKTQIERSASAPAVIECKASVASRQVTYSALLSKKKFAEAREALGDCPHLLDDAALLVMQKEATRLNYIAIASNQKAAGNERLAAITALGLNFTGEAEKYESSRVQLQAQADRADAASLKRTQLAEAARKKKQGVSIGMSQADAVASSWGRPEKVNRTTNAYGTREQWVYDGSYLYFENGVLTSIQN